MVKEEVRCKRKTHRTKEEIESSIKRLNRIEGQISGIKKMIQEDRHCDDILIQISAANMALKSLGEELLTHHMKTCLIDDIKNNDLESIDEVIYLYRRLFK